MFAPIGMMINDHTKIFSMSYFLNYTVIDVASKWNDFFLFVIHRDMHFLRLKVISHLFDHCISKSRSFCKK